MSSTSPKGQKYIGIPQNRSLERILFAGEKPDAEGLYTLNVHGDNKTDVKSMNEEKKATDAAEQEKTDADTTEETEVEETEESAEEEKAEDTDNTIDYEAEIEKERAARKKAENALAEKRFKAKHPKQQDQETDSDDTEEEDEEEKPLTVRDLQKILAQERQQTQKDLQVVQAEEIAKRLAGSDAEKNLILEIHKNRTFPAYLSLADQIEEAYIIANRKKFIGENSELKRALRAKDGVNNNAAGTHQKSPKGPAPKFAPKDEATFAASGFKMNLQSRRYEKKLPNGNILIINPKTKQTELLKKAA